MNERTVKYSDGIYDVVLVVRQASVVDGFKRIALQVKFLAQAEECQKNAGDETVLGLSYLALRTMPDCIAATVSVENAADAKAKLVLEELTVDSFMGLPEALVIQWEEAVYELMPHWLPKPKETEEGEAQEPADSLTSTKG